MAKNKRPEPDLITEAQAAPVEARAMPQGPGRTAAMQKSRHSSKCCRLTRNHLCEAGEIHENLEHDPEKWVPVFPRDKREAFARRSCSNKKIERDDDSKKSHPALVGLS